MDSNGFNHYTRIQWESYWPHWAMTITGNFGYVNSVYFNIGSMTGYSASIPMGFSLTVTEKTYTSGYSSYRMSIVSGLRQAITGAINSNTTVSGSLKRDISFIKFQLDQAWETSNDWYQDVTYIIKNIYFSRS